MTKNLNDQNRHKESYFGHLEIGSCIFFLPMSYWDEICHLGI